MKQQQEQPLPLPDKKIPAAVIIIGTFEIAVALLGLIVLILVGQFSGYSVALLILLVIYGAMGAGLWAIQEWARVTNIALHIFSIPYVLYSTFLMDEQAAWQTLSQLLIAVAIIVALTRPEIRHKFQTVVPKQKHL